MTNPNVLPVPESSTAGELACPNCGFNLGNARLSRCPECHVYFDAATITQLQRRYLANACWPRERARIAVVIAGLTLLPFLWLAVSVTTGNPTWWKPFPLIYCFATVLLGSQISVFATFCVLVSGSFLLYTWPLSLGQPRIPWWSVGTIVILQFLNGLYLVTNYSDGVETQGEMHTNVVCIVTATLFLALVMLTLANQWRPSFLVALTFHWLAWLWLVMYLFPLLGPFIVLV